MNVEKFHELVLKRIARGHFHTLKKGVSKKKSPTGKAIKPAKERVPSCATKAFYDKALMLKAEVEADADVTDELRAHARIRHHPRHE